MTKHLHIIKRCIKIQSSETKQINNRREIMSKEFNFGEEFDKTQADNLKQAVMLLSGLSRTIVAADNVKNVYDVLDMIHMQQEAMKVQIKGYGGSYE